MEVCSAHPPALPLLVETFQRLSVAHIRLDNTRAPVYIAHTSKSRIDVTVDLLYLTLP